MLNKLKSTAKHTFIYSLGNFSTKVVGLVLLPLYTAKLTLLDYGKFTILETTAMFMAMIFGLRIVSSMMRWSAETEDKTERKSILFNSYFMLFFVAILLNVLLNPFREIFSNLLFGTTDYVNYFTVIFMTVGFEIINQVPMNLFRFREQSAIYTIFFVSKLNVVLLLNIFFLVKMDIGVIGIFYSQLIANILQFIFSLPILLKNFNYHFNFKLIKEMLGYGVPLIFSAISVQLLAIGDKYIIRYLLGYEAVGIYSLGGKISGVLNVLVVQSFQLAFVPIAFKMFKQPDAKEFFKKVFKYFAVILLFGAFTLSIFSREILEIFAQKQEYVIAYKIVPFITLAFVFKGLQNMFALAFYFKKKTKQIAVIVSVAVLINFGLNYFFIKILQTGISGAAFSTVLSTLFIMIILYFASRKIYLINYEIGKIFIALLVAFILFLIQFFVNFNAIFLQIVFKLSLCLLFPILLYLFGFFEKTELAKIREIISKIGVK